MAVSWAAFIQGTNIVYSGAAAARNQVVAPVALGDLQTAVRSLLAAKAYRFTTTDNGGLNENTYPRCRRRCFLASVKEMFHCSYLRLPDTAVAIE